MHEFALAEAVITTALEAARKQGMSEVTKLVVRVGELQRIRNETFEQALREAMPPSNSSLEGAAITFVTEPAKFRCRGCGDAYGMADGARPNVVAETEAVEYTPQILRTLVRCPGCHSPDFEVVQGRGVMIDTLEGT